MTENKRIGIKESGVVTQTSSTYGSGPWASGSTVTLRLVVPLGVSPSLVLEVPSDVVRPTETGQTTPNNGFLGSELQVRAINLRLELDTQNELSPRF